MTLHRTFQPIVPAARDRVEEYHVVIGMREFMPEPREARYAHCAAVAKEAVRLAKEAAGEPVEKVGSTSVGDNTVIYFRKATDAERARNFHTEIAA